MPYNTPGVYVEEISSLPPAVQQVESAVPVFIGTTEKAVKDNQDLTLAPTLINSIVDYREIFGSAQNESAFNVVVKDLNTGRTVDISHSSSSPFIMYYGLQWYFANGGQKCYIVSVDQFTSENTNPATQIEHSKLELGLEVAATIDEPTLIVFPDATQLEHQTDFYTLYMSAISQCHERKDRFTIIDTYKSEDLSVDIETLRNSITGSRDILKYAAAYYPHLKCNLSYQYAEDDLVLKHHVETGNDNFIEGEYHRRTLTKIQQEDVVLYGEITSRIAQIPMPLPPSCAIAGIYARVDRERGVWKAPANVSVQNVIEPLININGSQQDDLNVDAASGKSVNAIRQFQSKVTLVWGARTFAGNDLEWRYVPVVRFFIIVEESLKKATERFVFEPNDANAWVRIKAMIENFLTIQWRNGALAGSKPEHAFFVNVGLGETMTPQDILEGRLIIVIGMAVVRPAEFIILRIMHRMPN